MKIKLDSWVTGIILGIIAPLVGLLVFKQYKLPETKISVFFNDFFLDKQYRSLLSGMLSVSLLANAIVFTIFIQFDKDKAAKGVFITTALYGIAILLIKTFA